MQNPTAPSRQRKRRSTPQAAAAHTGKKCVSLTRGWCGYGFTICSQRPCVLSCVLRNSPADLAGLRAGQALHGVNGLDVAQLPHDDVVRLIGQSAGTLRLQVNTFCNRSDSGKTKTLFSIPSESSTKAWSVPGSGGSDRQRVVPRPLVLQSASRARAYARLRERASLHGLPWKSCRHLSEQVRDDSSWIASSLPCLKDVIGQEFSGYLSADKRREVIGSSFTLSGQRTNLTVRSARRIVEKEQSPRGDSQTLQSKICNDCTKAPVDADLRTAVKSNGCATTPEVSINQSGHLSRFLPAVADTMSIVGYIGSIQLPYSANSSSSRYVQQVRGAVRRLRKMQKLHAVVLMEVRDCGVRLTAGSGGTVAFYPAPRVLFASVCPDHRQFFGIITGGEAEGRESRAVCCSLSACHVFMVDAFMACHARHVHRARLFGLHCVPHPDTHLCPHFLPVPDPLVQRVASLYDGASHSHTRSPHSVLDLAHHPPHQDSTTSSSGSDSGLSMGHGDVCDHGVYAPEFAVPTAVEEERCSLTYDGLSQRFRIPAKNTPDKTEEYQTPTYLPPLRLSPELGSPQGSFHTPLSPQQLLTSPVFPPCPHNTPQYLLPESSSPECLNRTFLDAHELQASVNAGFLPDSPQRLSLSLSASAQSQSTALAFPTQSTHTMSSDQQLHTDISPGGENAPTEDKDAGRLLAEVSHKSVDVGWTDCTCRKECRPCTNTATNSTQSRLPISGSVVERQQQNAQHKGPEQHSQNWQQQKTPANWSEQHQNWQQRVGAWLQEEPCPCLTGGEVEPSDLTGGEVEPRPGLTGGEVEPRPGLTGGEVEPRPGLTGGEVEPRPGLTGGEVEPRPGLTGGEVEPRPGLTGGEVCGPAGLGVTSEGVVHASDPETSHHLSASSAPVPSDDLGCEPQSSPTFRLPRAVVIHGNQSARAAGEAVWGRVAGWGLCFPRLLADPLGLRLFTEFLQSEHSEENIKFWNDVELFKRLSDHKTRRSRALRIYHTYLSAEADDPVNVDSDARAVCLTTNPDADDLSEQIFDAAQQQVYHLMRMDCYGRFLTSDLYKGHLRRESEGQKLSEIQTIDPVTTTKCQRTVTGGTQKRKKSFLLWKNNKKSGADDTSRKRKKEKMTKQDRNNVMEEPGYGLTTRHAVGTENAAKYKDVSLCGCEAGEERERRDPVAARTSGSTLRGLFAKLCPRQRVSGMSSSYDDSSSCAS
ncbi:hypothetical protein ACOMHN_028607 [Nucella lapillus]